MAITNPDQITVGDLCTQALKECGLVGVGQVALPEDINDAWVRLQMMLQQWAVKRFLVYHLVDYAKVSTGAQFYTVGPGGDFDTGAASKRPDKIESAFLRQQVNVGLPVDYGLDILQAREDYNRIALKSMVSFPGCVFLDAAWPLAKLLTYPVPNSAIYELHITLKEQLPYKFANLGVVLNLPYEYYAAILYSLALRLKSKHQIPSFPGDPLPGMVRDAMATVRGSSTGIAELVMPQELVRGSGYNIFSDQNS